MYFVKDEGHEHSVTQEPSELFRKGRLLTKELRLTRQMMQKQFKMADWSALRCGSGVDVAVRHKRMVGHVLAGEFIANSQRGSSDRLRSRRAI